MMKSFNSYEGSSNFFRQCVVNCRVSSINYPLFLRTDGTVMMMDETQAEHFLAPEKNVEATANT